MLKNFTLILLVANFTNYQTHAIANLTALKRLQPRVASLPAYSTSGAVANKNLPDELFINHAKTCREFRDNKLKARFDRHPLRKCFQDKAINSYLRTGPTYHSDGVIIAGQPPLFNYSCIDRGSPKEQASFWAFNEILRGSAIQEEDNRLLYYYLTYRVNIFKTVERLNHQQALQMIKKIKKMATRLYAMGEWAFPTETENEMLYDAFNKHVQQDLELIRAIEPILQQKKDQICEADVTQSIQKSGYQSKDQIWHHGRFDQALYEMVAKINRAKN